MCFRVEAEYTWQKGKEKKEGRDNMVLNNCGFSVGEKNIFKIAV